MNFRPCIDLHNGKVKQIIGGTLTGTDSPVVENFVADKDADYYASMFKRDGLAYGHVIMLGAGNEVQALKALKAYPGGLQVGGGINPENAAYYLEKGASHVIVTSYVFKNGDINILNLGKIKGETGKDRLVVDISCRKKNDEYYVVTDRWSKFTDFSINKENMNLLSGYCSEILVHAVDVEGKCMGVNTEIIDLLSNYSSIPVTYAGGARSLEDIELVYNLGKGVMNLTIGSALDIFGGSLSYNEVVKWFRELE